MKQIALIKTGIKPNKFEGVRNSVLRSASFQYGILKNMTMMKDKSIGNFDDLILNMLSIYSLSLPVVKEV